MIDAAGWLEQYASEPFTYLTTTGRRSGQPHRIEIWFGVDQDRMFLMAGGRDTSDWVKNLIADSRVTVELGGETRRGNAYVIHATSADDALARELLVRKYRQGSELDDWRERSLPVVVTFTD